MGAESVHRVSEAQLMGSCQRCCLGVHEGHANGEYMVQRI